MVLDMLTSPQEQSPPRVTPMKEDSRNSPSALCPSHRNGRLPQAVPHAPVLHCSDDPGSSSATQSPKTFRTSLGDGADPSEQKLYSDTFGTERPQDGEESRLGQTEDKPTRSCKRKLDLTSLSLGSNDATKSQDSEKKGPESPPPAKRWVIGPLFQSFKSKMASFTEIVMSPVRLFKPNELPAGSDDGPPSVTTENDEGEGTDGKEEQIKSPVVQRLNFDTESITVSDSEQNKVTILQNGSERRGDSIPEDGGTFGLLNPTSTRTSLREGSEKAKQESTVLCEPKTSHETTEHEGQAEKSEVPAQNQPLPKKLRLPTLAVGKRKKGRRLDMCEREEMVESVGGGCTVGTLGREEGESPAITQTKTLENETPVQTLNPRKPRVSVNRISISMCNSGGVQTSALRPRNSSEGERIGLKRASRSRSKTENDVKCTLVASDFASDSTTSISPDHLGTNGINNSTPAGGPPSTGTCATRRRKQAKPNGEIKPDIAGSRRGDPTERLRSSDGASDSKLTRRNDVCRAKRKTETSAMQNAKKTHVRKTRRVKRDVDAFEDQGMSMSLTLKVGSGLDGEKDADPVMTCGLTTKGRKTGDGAIRADASCPTRTTPEGHLCVKDYRLTDGRVEKPEADRPTRWCVYSERRETQEELENEDDPNACPTSSGSNGLKRSLSCPDITSLQHGNVSRTAPVHDKTLYPSSPPKKGPHVNVIVPSPIKRTRRHTVCSLEMAREIAPLCLRKEVYPTWGSGPKHSYPLSPSKSLAFLVSCFLSSPLAFLSKKSSRGHGDDSGYGAGGSDLAVSSSSSSSFPSPPSLSSPATSRMTGGSAFFADAPCASDQSSLSSRCSVFDAVSMVTDEAMVQQEENGQISAVSEEKAFSDSEIKTDNKQVEQRKVSSIRIRKTLPKPQYNLTPMGLPKAVRIKKKVFSVEEIYTNKNFSKPPEGRLETIFEVPLSRRDGSQSLIGPKRVKRFVVFPELGVARKPRRSLFGGAGGGGAQRKAAGNPGTGRTRRGREEEVVHLQDVDLLLCTKLNELDVWMAMEQMVY
ncbi:uncharacterized protein prr14 isoform X2 [Tachysurus fulvidraco]|uniref:uncharacterized protein prr14 isoform X2 n=1 Tax=Tachysurus fulvidraco TaxID=1234273 RepID=UPI001FEFAB2F|nr:uncharacterized protein prr14 isoform X2 [Tachysurus fulvidraco]